MCFDCRSAMFSLRNCTMTDVPFSHSPSLFAIHSPESSTTGLGHTKSDGTIKSESSQTTSAPWTSDDPVCSTSPLVFSRTYRRVLGIRCKVE
jgi:hypothetical protein